MHSVQTGLWEPRPPSKHATPLSALPPSNVRPTYVTTATPAKRITFYKSGDSQFGGVRMAIHKRSFKCFDTLLDDLSQKVPLPFGVRTVTTPRGIHTIKHLEQLQDGGCYLCSDRRYAKPINMELAGKRQGIWPQHSRRPHRPEASSGTPPGHLNLAHRQRRILLVKNSEPGMRRSIVLSRRSARSLRAFLDEVSEVMQFHVRKLYTAEGRRIDSVQSLMACPGVLVCVGREAFSPMLVNFIRKTSEEKLPGLGTKSPGLGPRTPGNGARSPAIQATRSSPHGAQSRSSEYDEGHESKKNGESFGQDVFAETHLHKKRFKCGFSFFFSVNFGLETKKSIIHPRSDSSNRSARFSLSSEKSFGVCPQARPAIMNDDIEKRVLVNKDGSLSVEMRVRFRLQNDETLQWSTQIKKSPSLTNDSCPASQAQSNYLQHGQSGSCSDPDSTSYEGMEYASQPLQCALEENHCPCCYQRREPQFDLWENPAHTHKPPPVPPPHAPNHAMMRHTHSSSSSSSCNSRRVVRCRARLSRSPGGSGSEQSQLVQEEMCVTEQVERRVEVAQGGDTQVEVCKVSRCCSRTEVVAMDTNLRPLSRKSVEGELMVAEDENRPLSAVSFSSHVLQSLKEDQDDEDDEDDDLPPSVSQCSHRNEPSPSPTPAEHLHEKPESMVSASSVHSAKRKSHEEWEDGGSRALSAASSCHCGAATPRVPSSVSNISNARIPKSEEEGADAEDEELKRGVSGLSGHTGLSVSTWRSGASSVCPDCGGCKHVASSNSNSRASKRSDHSNRTPQPVSPLPAIENGDDSQDDAASDDSAGSTQSNKTNLTIHGRLSATPNHRKGRAPSAMSGISNPESIEGEEERAPSATSHRSNSSNKSHHSGCNGIVGGTAENEEERAPSAASATSHSSNRSNKSNKSHQSGCNGILGGTAENEEERALSAASAASHRSNRSNKSHQSGCNVIVGGTAENEEERAPSAASATSHRSNRSNKSNSSHQSGCNVIVGGTAENEEERAPSAASATSHRSNKSNSSHQSGCNGILGGTAENEEERALSAVSATSHRSNKSNKSHQSGCNGILGGTAEIKEERAPSAASATSHRSNKSNSSHQSGCNGILGGTAEIEEERAPSAASATSHRSNRSNKSHQSGCDGILGGTVENEEERAPSAASATSHRSNRSNKSHQSGCDGILGGTVENEEERAPSAASATSHRSNKSNSSHQSGCNGILGGTAENEEERAPSAASATSHRSNRSNSSHQSGCNGILGGTAENEEERSPSAMSARSNLSAKSGKTQKSKNTTEVPIIGLQEEAEGENTVGRALSSLSNKSSASAKSHKSSGNEAAAVEDGEVDKRAPSSLSVRSNASAKSGKADSVRSDKSSKSNVSEKSHKSASCQCAKEVSPGGEAEEEPIEDVTAEGAEVEERAASAMSAKSHLSHKSAKASERSPSPRSEAVGDVEERAVSRMSGKLSAKSSKSPERKDNERATSSASGKSASSAKSHHANAEVDRSPSAASHRSEHTASSPTPDDADVPVIETTGEEEEEETPERMGSAMSVRSKSSVKSGASHKSNSGRNLTNSNAVTIKTPDGADKEGIETEERALSRASGKSNKSNHNGTTDSSMTETAEAGKEVGNGAAKCHGQTLSPRRTPSPRARAPKPPAASPVQQLLPNPSVGEKRGPSALSVHSTASAKSGRSKCSCGAASEHKKEEGEHKEDGKSEDSSSSKRQRKESEKPLSRNSSASASLGLPEDQDAADSDSGKSAVYISNNAEDKVQIREKTAALSASKSPKDSSGKGDEERARSAMSQKSNDNGRKSASSHHPPAVDIPTIETPRGGEDGGEEGGEQITERAASVATVKSGRSRKSCSDCGVKAAAQTLDGNSKERREVETESVKSASSKMDTANDRASSAMSGGAKARRKSPERASVSGNGETENQNFNRPGSEAKERKDITQNKTPSVYSQSPCCLRPVSAASNHSKSKDSVKSEDLNPVKGHKSCAGSEDGSVKMSSSKRKEAIKSSSPCPLHCSGPGSKVESGGESTLSHSLSAADLLKETIAAARQLSMQSKASGKSGRRSRNLKDQEGQTELTPACLPNASPNEVVSDWLRSIPTNSSMLDLGNELNEEEEEHRAKEMEMEVPEEETAKEKESPEEEKADKDEKVGSGEEEDKEDEDKTDAAEEKKSSRPAAGDAVGASLSKNWHCSAAVMKVLLSSSLGRCRSVPEVSPVYGRRLSTSATGLLDCLAQLQLIEPAVNSSGSHQQKDRKQQYDEIMAILQSLWLTEPGEVEVKGAKEAKNGGSQQVSPPRSSSGVGMSSGSGGSAKDNGNQGGAETPAKETKEAVVKVEEEKEEEEDAEAGEKEAEETLKADAAEGPEQIGEQSSAPQSPDSPKTTENPSSSDKSSTNDSSKSATDNERETLGDSNSGTPPTPLRAPLSKRLSQDPDPVWVLNLLKKLEKQFMSHYIAAMSEFKVRWDLDDSLILNTMMSELKEEVSRRIQSSIQREMRKIQSRAGKPSRSPRPPQLGNLSRESTMTEKRRRMLKVMKNQSVKTAESVSDEDTAGDFSDQRSEDEYCPCDACVRKKMEARPFRSNPLAAEAPVMMEFDLLKILQLKKSPSPAPATVQPEVAGERMLGEDEGRNLDIVEEEEEEYETKEDIRADIILEETIPEEDEALEEEEEEEDTAGEEAERDETPENGEEDEGECTCPSAREEEESSKEEERESAEETPNETGDEEQTGDDEAAENEGETGTGEEEEESDKETVREATASEEESDGSAAKNAKDAESTPAEELVEGNVSSSAEAEEEDGGDDATGEEEESQEDKNGGESEEQEGDASGEEGASSQVRLNIRERDAKTEQKHSIIVDNNLLPSLVYYEGWEMTLMLFNPQSQNAPVCVTEGEEADAEDSEDSKRQSDTGAEEAGGTGEEEEKESGEDGEEEEAQEEVVEEFKPEEESEEEEVDKNKKEDGALLHQFTRTSVESQPGSMEDVDVNSSSKPVDYIEVPKMADGVSAGGGAGQRRSRSPARVKRRKPKEIDTELEDF
ncbi:uncharacterized protein rp1l1a [Odontesthes bonariensis]